jgi:hypothetical protein
MSRKVTSYVYIKPYWRVLEHSYKNETIPSCHTRDDRAMLLYPLEKVLGELDKWNCYCFGNGFKMGIW